MKKFAVIYTMLDIDLNAQHRPAHVEHLRSLVREGRIVDGMKFPDYYPGCIQGVLICQAASKEEVQGWFARDPVIVAGARRFEVREYAPMSVGA